jgi:hypothetical protein
MAIELPNGHREQSSGFSLASEIVFSPFGSASMATKQPEYCLHLRTASLVLRQFDLEGFRYVKCGAFSQESRRGPAWRTSCSGFVSTPGT